MTERSLLARDIPAYIDQLEKQNAELRKMVGYAEGVLTNIAHERAQFGTKIASDLAAAKLKRALRRL